MQDDSSHSVSVRENTNMGKSKDKAVKNGQDEVIPEDRHSPVPMQEHGKGTEEHGEGTGTEEHGEGTGTEEHGEGTGTEEHGEGTGTEGHGEGTGTEEHGEGTGTEEHGEDTDTQATKAVKNGQDKVIPEDWHSPVPMQEHGKGTEEHGEGTGTEEHGEGTGTEEHGEGTGTEEHEEGTGTEEHEEGTDTQATKDRKNKKKENRESRDGTRNEDVKWNLQQNFSNRSACRDHYKQKDEEQEQHGIATEGLQLQPILLAKVEDDSFILDDAAFYYLLEKDELKGKPLAIVSIAGATRSGKSFIMNFFLTYLRNKGWENPNWFGYDSSRLTVGFPWKTGSEACTHGINVWPEIFHVPLNDGRECAVLIVDTQGLYDDDTSPDINAKLMSLSTLFSSHQILNLTRQILERDLEHLQLCASFGKVAAATNICGTKKAFQSLMFLVRDWEHSDKLGNCTDTYLLPYLKKSSKSSVVQKVKKSISDSFDQVQCYFLPHPGRKVTKNKEELRNEDVDEEFVMWAKMLVESVLHPTNIVVKKMGGGKDAVPDDLKHLIETVGKNFVGGKMPTAETLLQNIVRANNTKSMNTAVAGYREEMSKQIGNKIVKDDDIRKYHEASVAKALKTFNLLANIGEKKDKKEFRQQLRKECDDAHEYYREINEMRKSKQLHKLQTLQVKLLENYKRAMKEVDPTVTDEAFEKINANNIQEVQDAFDTEAKNLEEVLPQIINMKSKLKNDLALIRSEVAQARDKEKKKQRKRNRNKCFRLAHELENEFDNEVDQEHKEFKADLSSTLKASIKNYISQYTKETDDIPERDKVEDNKQNLQRGLKKIAETAEKLNKEMRKAVAFRFHQKQRECAGEYKKKLRKITLEASDDSDFDNYHDQYKADALETFNGSTNEYLESDFPEIANNRLQLEEEIEEIYQDNQDKRVQQKGAKTSKMKDEADRKMRRIFDDFEDKIEQHIGEFRTDIKEVLNEAKSACLENFKQQFSSGFDSDIVWQNEQILKHNIKKAIKQAESSNNSHKNSMITRLTAWKSACLAQYKSKMKNVELEELSFAHQQKLNQTLKMFDSKLKGNGNLEEVETLRTELDSEIEEVFVEFQNRMLKNREIKENELRAESENRKQEKIKNFERVVRMHSDEYKNETDLRSILQDEKAAAMKSYGREMMSNSQKDPESLEKELDLIKEESLSHNKRLEKLLKKECCNKGREFVAKWKEQLEKDTRGRYPGKKVVDDKHNDFLVNRVYKDEEYKDFPGWGQAIVAEAVEQEVTQLKEDNKDKDKDKSCRIS